MNQSTLHLLTQLKLAAGYHSAFTFCVFPFKGEVGVGVRQNQRKALAGGCQNDNTRAFPI